MKLCHCVFFTLSDKSEEKRSALIAAGEKYLKPHDGVVTFEMGNRNAAMQRDVNDQEYDVALVVVFDTQASHDAYQVSEMHNQFIAEQKDNWAQVRVFDANV